MRMPKDLRRTADQAIKDPQGSSRVEVAARRNRVLPGNAFGSSFGCGCDRETPPRRPETPEGGERMSQLVSERPAPDTRMCVFCAIVAGASPAAVVREWVDAVAIVPIDPVVDGHVIVLPRRHVTDAIECPDVTADVMRRAAELAGGCGDSNLLTSVGPAATQTVFHLHVHVVPRRFGDGLVLPWTPIAAAGGAGTTREEN